MSSFAKRSIFTSLVVTTIICLASLMIWAFAEKGLSLPEMALLACFLITVPWTAIGFWNAVIGFVIMRFTKSPAASVFPALKDYRGDEAITSSTALAMCIRNEDVDQVHRNLNAMIARLVASGEGRNFHVYVLSDSSFPEVIKQEKEVFARLARDWAGSMDVTYRLRTDNWGFKAGNIREFCEKWGDNHDFMLTLDADSVMSGSAMLRMVRIMQSNDKLGILQSLVVGLPSDSAFTRVFQFGMRMGMKSFTLGSAWWQADCGPYWGHNALIRLKPFIESCHLPLLPGKGPLSGYVLSHDQVEATFMRRAGYEVRVLADESGSYEENPPHILEFIRRDLRWCHGNMQYFKLLGEKGLLPTSRVQLALAILMFIGAPAWLTFVAIGTSALVFSDMPFVGFSMGPGIALFAIIMTMIFTPKIVSIIDVLLNSSARRAYGGGIAVLIGAFFEIVFSMLLAPIMAVAETLFLAGLPFGKARGWASQNRTAQSLKLSVLTSHLWPQMVFGFIGLGSIALSQTVSLTGFLVTLPVFVGPALVLFFGYTSAHTALGRMFSRIGLWQIPEEETPPIIVRALNLPALSMRAEVVNSEVRTPLTTDDLLAIDKDIDERIAA